MDKKILILLAEGFEEIEAVTSIDILRRAKLDVIIASVNDANVVKGAHGISIKADIRLRDFEGLPDAIVLPGGMPGSENLANSAKVTELIKRTNLAGKIIAAICAAPAIVLAPTGILDGKKATCYPQCESSFGTRTTYIDREVVVDGNIITSRGPGTALQFALTIVKHLVGDEIADTVKQQCLIK